MRRTGRPGRPRPTGVTRRDRVGWSRVTDIPGDRRFALLLTHDLDRPYKRLVHGLFHARRGNVAYHLRTALPDRNPYWQLDTIAEIERERGVRSAIYLLQEPHLLRRPAREWLSPRAWIEHLGRYRPSRPRLRLQVERLAAEDWELGVHGSLSAATDGERLAAEVDRLEGLFDVPIVGGRQHRLRLERPDTWGRQRAAGLVYDTSLGSSTEWGFQHGYEPLAPFEDEFRVFPLTLMDAALPDPATDFEWAWKVCEELLREADENQAVMTVLWHPRLFSETDFPGYRELYERLLDRALAMGAWVGSPGEFYRTLPGVSTAERAEQASASVQ